MKAKELDRLIFTPFHTSKILHYFLSGVQTVNRNGIKTELIFVVLPIIYNESFYSKLNNLNKNSRFFPFMNINKDLQIFLSQINSKIKSYKKASNDAIILLGSKTKLSINEMIKCEEEMDYKKEAENELKRIYKAAYFLGSMLAKERYLTVFLKLRITEI